MTLHPTLKREAIFVALRVKTKFKRIVRVVQSKIEIFVNFFHRLRQRVPRRHPAVPASA